MKEEHWTWNMVLPIVFRFVGAALMFGFLLHEHFFLFVCAHQKLEYIFATFTNQGAPIVP